MHGLMQDWPLTVDKILDHANSWFPRREVVTRSIEGPISRTTYGNIWRRAKQVTNALRGQGIQLGDRVAMLAWNTERHMERQPQDCQNDAFHCRLALGFTGRGYKQASIQWRKEQQ